MYRQLPRFFLFIVFVVHCATTNQAAQGGQPQAAPEITSRSDARAFLKERCLLTANWPEPLTPSSGKTPESGPAVLAAVLVAPAVEWTLSYFSRYLQEKQAKYTAVTTYTVGGRLYKQPRGSARPIPAHHCLVLVRGTFGGTTSGNAPDELWTPDRLVALNLIAPPDFYMEFGLDYLTEDAFRLIPLYLHYPVSKAQRSGKGAAKDLVMSVAFKSVAMKDGQAVQITFATFPFMLPRTPIGARFDEKALAGLTTDVQPLPRPLVGKEKGKKSANLIAFDAKIAVTETEEASPAYTAFVNVIENQKKDVVDAVTELARRWAQR